LDFFHKFFTFPFSAFFSTVQEVKRFFPGLTHLLRQINLNRPCDVSMGFFPPEFSRNTHGSDPGRTAGDVNFAKLTFFLPSSPMREPYSL